MTRYKVIKRIELSWEVEANSYDEAKAIVDDMGEHTGNVSEVTTIYNLGYGPDSKMGVSYLHDHKRVY